MHRRRNLILAALLIMLFIPYTPPGGWSNLPYNVGWGIMSAVGWAVGIFNTGGGGYTVNPGGGDPGNGPS